MVKKNPIAFDFVLDELHTLNFTVKPMFGCHAIYIEEAIVLVTRNKKEHPEDNGVWVATTADHHESLRMEFPSMRRIYLLGNSETNWQNLPSDSNDFEESVLKACFLIRKQDKRFGKIPNSKKRKKD